MKKNYLIFSLLIAALTTFNSFSQTYSSYGSTPSNDDYNYIDYSSDTMYYTFNSLASGAYSDASLVIEGEAYFDGSGSYNVFGPGAALLGNFTTTAFYSCTPFVSTITIPMATINSFSSSVVLKFVKQGNVYPYCSNNRMRAKLTYNYCTTGVPSEQASISLNDNVFCQSADPINLTGLPVGGTFSGAGITNGQIDPSALPYGVYYATYTFTEANGCYTKDSASFTVFENPADQSMVTCMNMGPTINTGNISTVYTTDPGLSDLIGIGTNVTLNPIITSPTEVYSAIVSSPFAYSIDAIDTANFQIADHDVISGDDRGGIAVTENYVYIVGDDATARFDLNLQDGIDLPKRDGIFTDLAQVKLYTIYNTAVPHAPNSDNLDGFTMNSLRSLNEDLSYGDELIMLSEPVTFGVENQAVMLAGYNELIVGTAYGNYDFYHISILNGLVTPIGEHNLDIFGSENWADWGMSGFDGTDRHAYFRASDDSIVDFNFTTDLATSISLLTDFSDMASFIVHPTNNRFYGHYEGGTSTFGGDDETIFYFQTTDTATRLTATLENYSCPNKITFTFNSIDLGADTTVCSEDGLYIISGGFGYESYTWNGVNNNFNSFAVQNSGEIVLSVVDEVNCTLTDSVNVVIDECTAGINELNDASMMIYPVPNNGAFQIIFNALAEEAQLSIVDIQGKQVATATVSKGETVVDMNLNVESGIYFVRLTSKNGTSQQAISIQ